MNIGAKLAIAGGGVLVAGGIAAAATYFATRPPLAPEQRLQQSAHSAFGNDQDARRAVELVHGSQRTATDGARIIDALDHAAKISPFDGQERMDSRYGFMMTALPMLLNSDDTTDVVVSRVDGLPETYFTDITSRLHNSGFH